MKTKTLSWLFLSLMTILSLTACSSEDGPGDPQMGYVEFRVSLPAGHENDQISELTLNIAEVNTGKNIALSVKVNDGVAVTTLPVGLYRITADATLTYRNEFNLEKTIGITAYKEAVTVTTDGVTVPLDFYQSSDAEPDPADVAYSGFVLAEIFCAGSATAQGTYYYADKYFVIYNNTDHVLYADSLLIAESDFLTVSKENYQPDIMSEAMAVKALYMIPGTGRSVPVQPGGRLLLVDNALNHTVANPNSWNLTTADYEWYDESTNPSYTDVDNPNVPNLERIYSNTLTMWSPHTQGFCAYALARMHTDRVTYLTDYTYDYSYHLVGTTGEADMTGTCYRLPNSWIIDAVNVSVPAMYQWLVTAPSLDRGYTYCAEFGWDDSRYGKSMRRKVASRDGSRAILQDTNNSSDDFEARATADPFHEFK